MLKWMWGLGVGAPLHIRPYFLLREGAATFPDPPWRPLICRPPARQMIIHGQSIWIVHGKEMEKPEAEILGGCKTRGEGPRFTDPAFYVSVGGGTPRPTSGRLIEGTNQ